MFEFKKFVDTGGSFSPKMTIRKGGSLGINQASARKFGIDADGYFAVFYYDKASRAIGLELTKDSTAEGAVKIQWRPYKGDNKNVIIQASIKSLLDKYEINYSESNSYIPFIDENSGLIVLDLNKPKAKRGKTVKSAPLSDSTPEVLPEKPPVSHKPVEELPDDDDDPFGLNEPDVPFG